MPPPLRATETGGRLSGEDMSKYMERFFDVFLQGRIRFATEITNIRRSEDGTWLVSTEHVLDGKTEVVKFSRIVLCTGVSAFASVENVFNRRSGHRDAVILTFQRSYLLQQQRRPSFTDEYCIQRNSGPNLMTFSRL